MKRLLNLGALALLFLGCAHGSHSLRKEIPESDKKVILQSDFSDEKNWLKTFEPGRPVPWTSGMDRAHVIFDSDKNHKVLEIKYPKGSLGPEQGGSQWISYLPKLPATSQEKVTASYWVRFPKNFDFVRGGKLPGLVGGHQDGHPDSTVTGGVHPTGKNGWSARIMWRKGGQIVQYVYHMNQPGKWGEDFKWEINGAPALFQPGVWQKLMSEVTMNTPGKRNGRIRSWLNDVQTLDIQNLEFRSTEDLKIDAFYFSTFFGGDEPDWAATKDESIRFDDFQVFK
jgi:hypothetical protein